VEAKRFLLYLYARTSPRTKRFTKSAARRAREAKNTTDNRTNGDFVHTGVSPQTFFIYFQTFNLIPWTPTVGNREKKSNSFT